jgi:Flp pilus assembly protein TadD
MQKHNDIYRKENPLLPKRRRGRHASREEAAGAVFPASSSSTSRRERPPMPVGNVDGRTDTHYRPRSNRRRRKQQGLSWPNKLLFGGMAALLLGYVAVLAYSTIKNRNTPEAQPAVAVAEPVTEDTPATRVEEGDAALVDTKPSERVDALDREREAFIREAVTRWKDALSHVERSRTARERGADLTSVAERLEETLVNSPSLLDVQAELADVYVELKRYDDAYAMYVSILESNPQDYEVRLKLAQVLAGMQQHRAALAMAQWLLEADAFAEQPNYVAALALLQLGQVNEAITHLRRLVSLNRENLIYRNYLAVALMRLGQHEQAETVLRDVLAEDPSNSVVYYNLAVSYAQQENAQAAVDMLQSAAQQFGMPFVMAWFESRELDPIRDTPAFQALRDEALDTPAP